MLMTDKQITRMERWALAVGGPVITAAISATAGILWGMYTQIQAMEANQGLWQQRVTHQLEIITARLDDSYTEAQAEREIERLDRLIDTNADRLENHEKRLQDLQERLDNRSDRST